MSDERDYIGEVIAEDVAKRYAMHSCAKNNYVPAKPVVDAKAYDELRQQLADVSNERDNFKAAYMERSNKTDWVQKSAHWSELGKHRADVMRDRLNASEARNAELSKVLAAVRDDVGLMGRFAIDTLIGKPREHILYRDGDSIGCIPASILDRNGQVCLAMCTVCGKAESELDGPCEGEAPSAPATDEQGAG